MNVALGSYTCREKIGIITLIYLLLLTDIYSEVSMFKIKLRDMKESINSESIRIKSQSIAVNSVREGRVDQNHQMIDNSPEAIQMRQFQTNIDRSDETIEMQAYQDRINEGQKKNTTGIPDHIKNGIEQLSGISLDDVKVYYNSSKPIEIGACAYAEGTNVYIASGQEEHLPHELWHIVQQKEGKVKEGKRVKGKKVNDNEILEDEATKMGNKGAKMNNNAPQTNAPEQKINKSTPVIQRKITAGEKIFGNSGNAIGELMNMYNIPSDNFDDDEWAKLDQWNKENKVFESMDDFCNALFPDNNGSSSNEEEIDFDDVFFPQGLWPETESMRDNMLNENYTKGDSIRGEGMDYKTVDKDAFEVKGKDKLALVIRMHRVKGVGDILEEYNMLKKLIKKVATAVVHEIGFYVIKNQAFPAMVMDRYQGSSKELVRQKKGNSYRVEDYKDNLKRLFPTEKECQNGIDSLGKIKSWIGNGKNAVDDIQFLIDNNGAFFINDANQQDRKYKRTNEWVIEELQDVLKERIEDLKEGDDSDYDSDYDDSSLESEYEFQSEEEKESKSDDEEEKKETKKKQVNKKFDPVNLKNYQEAILLIREGVGKLSKGEYEGYELSEEQVSILGNDKLTPTVPDGDCSINAVLESLGEEGNLNEIRALLATNAYNNGMINEEGARNILQPGNWIHSNVMLPQLAQVLNVQITIVESNGNETLVGSNRAKYQVKIYHVEGGNVDHYYGSR